MMILFALSERHDPCLELNLRWHRPAPAVPGEESICDLLNPQKRVSFRGTVIVEERRDGNWVADPLIHTAPLGKDASLGVVSLPCALLAPAEGANAVAWYV